MTARPQSHIGDEREVAKILEETETVRSSDELLHALNTLDLIRSRSISAPRVVEQDMQMNALARRSTMLSNENSKFVTANAELQDRHDELRKCVRLAEQRLRNFARIHKIPLNGDSLGEEVTDILAAFREVISGKDIPRENNRAKPVCDKESNKTIELQVENDQLRNELRRAHIKEAEHEEERQHLIELLEEERRLLTLSIPLKQDACVQTTKKISFAKPDSEELENENSATIVQLWQEQTHSLSQELVVCEEEKSAIRQQLESAHEKLEAESRAKALAGLKNEKLTKRVEELQRELLQHKIADNDGDSREELEFRLLETCNQLSAVQQEKSTLEIELKSLISQPETCCEDDTEQLMQTYVQEMEKLSQAVISMKTAREQEQEELDALREQVFVPKNDFSAEYCVVPREIMDFEAFLARMAGASHAAIQSCMETPFERFSMEELVHNVMLSSIEYEKAAKSYKRIISMCGTSQLQKIRELKSNLAQIHNLFVNNSSNMREMLSSIEQTLKCNPKVSEAGVETIETKEIAKCIVVREIDDQNDNNDLFECVQELFRVFLPDSSVVRRQVVMLENEEKEQLIDAAHSVVLLNKQSEMRIRYLEAVTTKLELREKRMSGYEQIILHICKRLQCSPETIEESVDATLLRLNQGEQMIETVEKRNMTLKSHLERIIEDIGGLPNLLQTLKDDLKTFPGFSESQIVIHISKAYAEHEETESTLEECKCNMEEERLQIEQLKEQLFVSDEEHQEVLELWEKALSKNVQLDIFDNLQLFYESTIKLAVPRTIYKHQTIKDDIPESEGQECSCQTDISYTASSAQTTLSLADIDGLYKNYSLIEKDMKGILLTSGNEQTEIDRLEQLVVKIEKEANCTQEEAEQASCTAYQLYAEQSSYESLLQQIAKLTGVGISINAETIEAGDVICSSICNLEMTVKRLRSENQALEFEKLQIKEQTEESLNNTKNQMVAFEESQEQELHVAQNQIERLKLEIKGEAAANTQYNQQLMEEFEFFVDEVEGKILFIKLPNDDEWNTILMGIIHQLENIQKETTDMDAYFGRILECARSLAQDDGFENEIKRINETIAQKNTKLSQYTNIIRQTGQVLAEVVANDRCDVYQSVVMLNRDYERIVTTAIEE